jgi:hypothetical protein
MLSRWVSLCFCGAALALGPAAGCNDGGAAPADGASAGSACNRANFVYLDGQARSIWVTGTFTQPGPWAKDLGSGALALTAKGQGAWMLRTPITASDRALYKFIVDGGSVWNFDSFNPVNEPDGMGGLNSVLGTRQTFILSAPNASSVLLTGSFTTPAAWAATEASGAVAMKKSGIGDYWVANVNLPAGRNLYKFIVDGSNAWMPDPINPDREPDGTGLGFNSVITICREQ